MEYLTEYVRLLNKAATESDVYGDVSQWQWERFKDGSQKYAVSELNTAFGFELGSYHYLQPAHLPTTSIGRLNGLVIVSANPGYRELINQKEHAAREGTAVANADFCRQFFTKYPQYIGTVRYWTYALRMWAMAFAPHHQEWRGRDLWAIAADEGWEIGGIDLLPFHSSRDGVTAMLSKPQGAEVAQIALDTLKMVCRLEPQARSIMGRRVVLVSSKAGDSLVRRLEADDVLCMDQAPYGPPQWKMKLLKNTKNGTAVISLPYQVFSRAAPPGYTRPELAHWIALAARK